MTIVRTAKFRFLNLILLWDFQCYIFLWFVFSQKKNVLFLREYCLLHLVPHFVFPHHQDQSFALLWVGDEMVQPHVHTFVYGISFFCWRNAWCHFYCNVLISMRVTPQTLNENKRPGCEPLNAGYGLHSSVILWAAFYLIRNAILKDMVIIRLCLFEPYIPEIVLGFLTHSHKFKAKN